MTRWKRAVRGVGRLLFYGLTGLFWLGVIGVALEGYQAWRWGYIERHNPFVLYRHGIGTWPGGDTNERVLSVDAMRGPGAGTKLDPEVRAKIAAGFLPVPEEQVFRERLGRAEHFLTLTELPRTFYANCYGKDIFLVDEAGQVLEKYPVQILDKTPPLIESVTTPEIARVLREQMGRAFADGQPRDVPDVGMPGRGLFVLPLKDPSGRVTRIAAFWDSAGPPSPEEDPDQVWERSFFIYKKHGFRSADDFHTNNFGWRGGEVLVPRPAGLFRILCVGGSTTEEGPSSEGAYPGVLERRLREQMGAGRVEVVNCGIPGLNSTKEYLRMPDYLMLDGNFAVYYNGINDICHQVFKGFVFRAEAWNQLFRRSRFLAYYFNRSFFPSDEGIVQALNQQVISNLRGLHAGFKTRGIEMAFCSFAAPDLEHLSRQDRDYYDYYFQQEWGGRYVTFATYCHVLGLFNNELKKLCAELGAQYIPVAENLKGGTDLFGDPCHMKNRGIERKAEIIFEAIRDRAGASAAVSPAAPAP